MKVEQWRIRDQWGNEVGRILTANDPMIEFAEEMGVPVKILRDAKFTKEVIPVAGPEPDTNELLAAFEAALRGVGHVS